ncbi:hypothetical protein [Streptomyces sp. NPDC086023]|uniref:hypothetical protein n=1 Tax=Streptomyces sp. NPDC086023 TaxID=3365746 RepID=UPI0037CE2F05
MGVFAWFRRKDTDKAAVEAATEEAPVTAEAAADADGAAGAVVPGAGTAAEEAEQPGGGTAAEAGAAIPRQQSADGAVDSETGDGARM